LSLNFIVMKNLRKNIYCTTVLLFIASTSIAQGGDAKVKGMGKVCLRYEELYIEAVIEGNDDTERLSEIVKNSEGAYTGDANALDRNEVKIGFHMLRAYFFTLKFIIDQDRSVTVDHKREYLEEALSHANKAETLSATLSGKMSWKHLEDVWSVNKFEIQRLITFLNGKMTSLQTSSVLQVKDPPDEGVVFPDSVSTAPVEGRLNDNVEEPAKLLGSNSAPDDFKLQLGPEKVGVQGVVLDSKGNPIPDAKVQIYNGLADHSDSTTANKNGVYQIVLYEKSNYTIIVVYVNASGEVEVAREEVLTPTKSEVQVSNVDLVSEPYMAPDECSKREVPNIHFEVRKAIPKMSLPELESRLSSTLMLFQQSEIRAKYVIKIYGYTSAEGNYGMNRKLSEQRAEFIKNLLVNKKDINESSVVTVGMGPTNKWGRGNDMWKNRCVLIKVEEKQCQE
jgi:outer membrane protein OmpA-like peptidoglycan-associated protein